MMEWWTALDTMRQVFYLIAIPFTVILVLQTVMLLIGLGHSGDGDMDHDFDHDMDHDFDHDFDHDMDHDFDHDVNADMDHDVSHDGIGAQHGIGLRMLSLRGIVAFMAVCGWVGVSALDLGAGNGLSVTLALAAGFLAMFLVAVFMRMMTGLQQSGNLDVSNAVGAEGEVYIPLSAEQKGKITLVLQERLVEMDAIGTGDLLKTGRRVRVIRVADNNLLVVEAAE